MTYDRDYSKALTWESYTKGKLSYKQEYAYNENGKEIGYKSYWGKNKASPKREVKYSYQNDKLITINNFKNGEPIGSSKITYN